MRAFRGVMYVPRFRGTTRAPAFLESGDNGRLQAPPAEALRSRSPGPST